MGISESQRKAQQKYFKSPKGKKALQKAAKKYHSSPKGKETSKRIIRKYNNSPKGKEMSKRASKKYCLKLYGVSVEEYNEIFNNQEGKCAICDIPQSELKSRLGVDHNHVTNQVRGLLCHKCNLALGLLDDSIEILDRAKVYLLKS